MLTAVKFIGRNIVTIVLVVLGIIIGGYLSGTVDTVRDFFFPEAAAYVRSTRTIVNSIHGIGQLVTVSAEVDKTDVRVEISEGFLNAGYYSESHVAIGVIEAGIEFAAIDEDSISYDEANDRYTLTLPPPTITSCRIEYIDQYGGSLTLLPADWDVIRQLAQHDAISLFVQDMIEARILDRAEEESTLRMGDFVSAMTGKQTQIEFERLNGELELPVSCNPDPPVGWRKDSESGAWGRSN